MNALLAVILLIQSGPWVAVHTGERAEAFYVFEQRMLDRARERRGGEVLFYPVFAGAVGPDSTRAVARVGYRVNCTERTIRLLHSAQEGRSGFPQIERQTRPAYALDANGDSRIVARLVCDDGPLEVVVSGADWSETVDALNEQHP